MPSPAKYWCLLLVGLCMSAFAYAQKQGQQRIDSLQRKLPLLTNDSDKVIALSHISFAYFPIDPRQGIAYGEKCLQLARRIGFGKGEALAYNALGANYWAKRNFLKAQDYYLKALKINTRLKDKAQMARNIHNIADIYLRFDPNKALGYYQKAVAIAREINDQEKILGYQANISSAYQVQGNYSEALNYLQKSVDLAKKLHRQRDVAAYESLMGIIEMETGHYNRALQLATDALSIFRQIAATNPAKDDIPRTLLNIAKIYGRKSDSKNALLYNQEAFRLFDQLPGNMGKDYAAECQNNIGQIYLNLVSVKIKPDTKYVQDTVLKSQLRHSEAAFRKSISISLLAKQWDALTIAQHGLVKVQKLLGQPYAALATYEDYSDFKDSVYNAEMNKSIALHQMDFEYNQEKDSLNTLNKLQASKIQFLDQQRVLDHLKVKQQWLYFFLTLIIFCLIAFYFLYRYRLAQVRLNNDLHNEKMNKQLQEAEYKKNMNQNTLATLISQMNPHFIFNALNTIQSYIYSDNKKLAGEYLGKFSDLTRKILDNSNKATISLAEELALLNLYLDIEKTRFGEELNIVLRVSPAIDPENFYIPPMLIQPFVENAIKHGLMHSNNTKQLLIEINVPNQIEDTLEIIIDDNGIGREQSKWLNSKRNGHRSFANDANKKRIDIINLHLEAQKIALEIIDKKAGDGSPLGTKVVLLIPNSLD